MFLQTLSRWFGISKERFASPLNFNRALLEYWSAHEADKVFGAHHDAYRCQWTAASQANAEYEHDEPYKAMQWAIHSALANEDTPTLTLLIHPAWDTRSSTAYHRWLEEYPDTAEILMRIPNKRFKFIKPTQWESTRNWQATLSGTST